jgi:GT2 family glycosyltransferase/ADP-heptose:LPS heptosyltransferase
MFKESEVKKPVSTGPTITVRRYAALGDCLASSVVADKLAAQNYRVVWESHASTHCIMRRQPSIDEVREPNGAVPGVNLDGAYEKHPGRRRLTFAQMFMERANVELARMGINLGPPVNCKPFIYVSPAERHAAQLKFKEYPKPWTFICPRSDHWKNRTVPDGVWTEAAKSIHGTKFWLGWKYPAPAGMVDLQCNHIDNLIVWLTAADLLVTVDTGPMHIAAALNIPILALGQSSSPELHLNDQTDFLTIVPKGLDCLNCQQNICPIPNRNEDPPCQNFDPDLISGWANKKLGQIYGNDVSAIIPVFGPDPATFQRCLDAVAPQVQEIIVTAETEDKLPPNAKTGGKVRCVVKGIKGIGYGRNMSFGIRHSTGKLLMCINDDVFLDPGCVDLLRAQMKPGVGCVSSRLMYPDGTVYFCGKVRGPNEMGWGHKNHRQHHWDIKEPTEMENGYQAASLVSRKAFYDCGAFDERFFLYADDDAISLQLRRAGWKIVLEPRANGVHLEGQSTIKVNGNRMDVVQRANKVFNEVWGWY